MRQRTMGRELVLVLLAVSALLAACSTISHKPMAAAATRHGHKTLAIFLDGTANDEKSDTNIKRLHSLVTLQNRRDIATLYVEGVGTGTDVMGMGVGLGMKARVKIAYEFILNHYEPGDRIFIFGFSRGAYGGRILASLLYHAGIVKSDRLTTAEIAAIVYDSVKQELPATKERDRLKTVRQELREQGLTLPSAQVEVELLGLWDTVEAMGYRDGGSKLAHKAGMAKHIVDLDNANARYGDKLCNVRNVRHAMSIDDNREWIFTPRLMTRGFLFDGCAPGHRNPLLKADGKVDRTLLKEVWFAGAHSDVGGGYADSHMSGVSMNWMLQELAGFDLVPNGAAVPEDGFGTSHNPEAGWFSALYHSVNRDVVGYSLDAETVPGYRGTLCVHTSVFARRQAIDPKSHESRQLKLHQPGRVCLVDNEDDDLAALGHYKEGPQDGSRFCKAHLQVLEGGTSKNLCERMGSQ